MKVIIIEDEAPVRSVLKKILKLIAPEIEIIAEGDSISSSVSLLNTLNPDLVFMDIELKDGISFELLKQVSNIKFQIIFLTAFNHYAIKAFKFSAIDYLLKPIDPEELKQAILKAEMQIKKESVYQDAINTLQANLDKPQQLVIKTIENRYIIPFEDIIRFEADGSYTHVIHTKGRVLCSKNLKHYEGLLQNEGFFRCHQSHLIHLKKVTTFSKDTLILTNGDSIPVSHRRKSDLKIHLNQLLS